MLLIWGSTILLFNCLLDFSILEFVLFDLTEHIFNDLLTMRLIVIKGSSLSLLSNSDGHCSADSLTVLHPHCLETEEIVILLEDIRLAVRLVRLIFATGLDPLRVQVHALLFFFV